MSGSPDELTTFMISFDARAIREHFEDAPDEELINGMSDEQLDQIGIKACDYFGSFDRIWELFGEALGAAIREATT